MYGVEIYASVCTRGHITLAQVTLIEHGEEGVTIHTEGGGDGFRADAVLVTVPLGVLKVSWPGFPTAGSEASSGVFPLGLNESGVEHTLTHPTHHPLHTPASPHHHPAGQ